MFDEPKLEAVMIDNDRTVEERVTYLLNEADLRHHEGPCPMDVVTMFDAVSDIYVSAYRPIKESGRELTDDERAVFSRLKNTSQYLQDCLKNPGLGFLQPDAQSLRNFWKIYSRIDYSMLNN